MAKLGSAYVSIGAQLGPLKRGLASALQHVKRAMASMARVAKIGMIAFASALAYATYAAVKQEAAEIELASALKISGQYTEEMMKKLLKEAQAIQKVTTLGDEYVLTLQRMALTQGIMADEASNAAKAAIALYAGFGGGRGKPEIFLRYYIDAIRKTGSSLESYVGALRKAKTEEERHIVLQKAVAFGWDVAQSKAQSAGGALLQMKNAIGDVAEKFGNALLPMIKEMRVAMLAWIGENQEAIKRWADTFAKYVTKIVEWFKWLVQVIRSGDLKAAINEQFAPIAAYVERTKAVAKSTVRGVAVGGLVGGAIAYTRASRTSPIEPGSRPWEKELLQEIAHNTRQNNRSGEF